MTKKTGLAKVNYNKKIKIVPEFYWTLVLKQHKLNLYQLSFSPHPDGWGRI
jgi:hypothetical protein